MSLYLIDNATVNYNVVVIKFGRTVKISSLVNANFIVQTTAATPSVISNPFKTIVSLTDYNQINRTLTLYWNKVLPTNTEFVIRLVNLVDSSGITVGEEKITFTTALESATPSVLQGPTASIINEVLVEDKSIRADIDSAYQIIAKNPEFYIESISPMSGEFFVPSDDNNGRAVVTFNQRPASNFLTTQYFKVQRKKILKTPSRWETVAVQISMHSFKPVVYIDFPSIGDATPSYYADGKTYYDSGYKYRIIISSQVGV